MSLIKSDNIKLFTFNYEDDVVNVPRNFRVLKTLRRHSKDIGNDRDLPYIKEIFDNCSLFECDVFGYINSDILLDKSFFNLFKESIDAYVFYRKEIIDTKSHDFINGDFEYVWGGDKHVGNDAIFFNKDWWIGNRHKFPDSLILGETEWDTCYRRIIKGESNNFLMERSLWHVFHHTNWKLDSKGALNNISVLKNIEDKYGEEANKNFTDH